MKISSSESVYSATNELISVTLYLETYINKINDIRKIVTFLKVDYDKKIASQKTGREALKVVYVGI